MKATAGSSASIQRSSVRPSSESGAINVTRRRRRQKRYRSRVNNLEDIKAQGVGHQRQHQESREHRPSPSRGIPAEKKRFGCNLRSDAIHRGGVAASATDVMPCSSAAFVTSATVSYEAERSALMMIDWSLRLAASSNGPSCSMVTRWS